ncbi:MAG: thioredoxin domain-containing protein [Ardenticatenales bacterium]|jgi:protein-disulfide isomerase|nr:thioredoxin domain-containing protein [Ardenticatenales bacterium]
MAERKRTGRATGSGSIEVSGFAAAFVGVLVVGGVLIAGAWWWRAWGGAVPTTANPSPPAAPTTAIPYDALNGVTAAGEPQLGLPTAPVEIIAYGDYLCPNCRQFARDVLPAIKDRWIRTGFVRIVQRDFIVFGPEAQRAAEAAHCAGEHGRYWRYADGLYSLRGSGETLDVDHLVGLARTLDLDTEAFQACAASGRHRARVEATTASAKAQGFSGTPVYLINGRKLEGAIPPEEWVEMLRLFEQELGQGRPLATAAP